MAERENKVTHYLTQAKIFAEAAVAEFDRGEKEGRDTLIRDAAEKA